MSEVIESKKDETDSDVPEEWKPRIERTREIASYAETLVKEFPEITLHSWHINYRFRQGQWKQPGLTLNLTGPELAVRAFLSCLGLARNLERYMIRRGAVTGGTSVMGFEAQLEPGEIV